MHFLFPGFLLRSLVPLQLPTSIFQVGWYGHLCEHILNGSIGIGNGRPKGNPANVGSRLWSLD